MTRSIILAAEADVKAVDQKLKVSMLAASVEVSVKQWSDNAFTIPKLSS